MISFSGCEKTEDFSADVVEHIDAFLKYDLDEGELVANDHNPEDAQNNVKLFKIAKAIKEVLKDPETRLQLVNVVKEKGNGYVRLLDLMSDIPEIQAVFQDNSFDASDFELPYLETLHEAVVNIPNIEVADPSYNPLVSPGIEVEDDESKGMDDFIFSWYLTNEDTFEEIAVGEEQALSMKNPLFVITPHPVEGEERNESWNITLPNNGSAENIVPRGRTPYYWDRLRVNHRYEKTGKSEVWIVNYRIDENGGSHWLPNSGGPDGKRELAKLSKSQIGVTQIVDIGFLDPNGPLEEVAPACCNAAFFAIWERDWYASLKDLGSSCYNSTTLYFDGRRKYAQEWYSYDPSDIDISCSSSATIQESEVSFDETIQLFTFQKEKGFIRLNYQP